MEEGSPGQASSLRPGGGVWPEQSEEGVGAVPSRVAGSLMLLCILSRAECKEMSRRPGT